MLLALINVDDRQAHPTAHLMASLEKLATRLEGYQDDLWIAYIDVSKNDLGTKMIAPKDLPTLLLFKEGQKSKPETIVLDGFFDVE